MSFDPEKITFFAKTDARGTQTPFGIRAKDRQRHMYIVGKTGMGKSTLLENMAVQDIQNGEGMAFIDPHGSAAEVLLDYIPEHRVNDVVYFAPFDLENPISFNVMEDVGVEKRHLVVSGLMSTFKKIWVDAWSARMEYILTNALLVLIEYPDTTLLSVNRLFNDKAYRLKVVDYCTDPAVKSFWVDEFANYTERFAAEALPAIQNKIGQFTGNPLIRNIIGQPHSSFDFREMMDQKKIVIMNLSKGLIGETNANLLGSMLTTRIYLAAMSRADLPVAQMKQMPNFYFYVDEFQSFANATFANILSEARKYHLNLIIAHQYIEQMEEEVRDAVFGNVGTTIAFRVGPFDAETLETVFTPRFLAADLVNLGFAQIYLTLMIDGIGSQPFSAQTLTPIVPPAVSCRQMVIAASRKNFTKPRLIVEQIVTELHTPAKPPVPEKKTVTKVMPRTTTTTTTTTTAAATATTSTATVATTVTGVLTPATDPVGGIEKKTITTTPSGGVNKTAPDTMRVSTIPHPQTPLVPALKTHDTKTEIPAPPAAPQAVSETATVSPVVTTRPTPSRPVHRPKDTSTLRMVGSSPKVRSNTTSVGDLRSVLAKIAQTSNTVENPQKGEYRKNAGMTTKEGIKPVPGAISPLKDALAALHSVSETPDRVLPPRPVKPADVPKLHNMNVRDQADLAAMTAEAEADFAAIMASVPPPQNPRNLDGKHVAKILKSGGHQKTPF